MIVFQNMACCVNVDSMDIAESPQECIATSEVKNGDNIQKEATYSFEDAQYGIFDCQNKINRLYSSLLIENKRMKNYIKFLEREPNTRNNKYDILKCQDKLKTLYYTVYMEMKIMYIKIEKLETMIERLNTVM